MNAPGPDFERDEVYRGQLMSATASHVRFSFGEFELDPSLFELRRGGCHVPLQPKVLKLLFYLIENRTRVVSQSELLDVLWPGETVSTTSVRRAVRCARRALGDDGESQASIQTLPRCGYRFVRRIEEVGENGSSSAAESSAMRPSLGQPEGRPERSSSLPSPPVSLDDVFVGRSTTLELLVAHLTRALSGSGGIVLLSGEPGIGKTRTAQELSSRAEQLGADVLFGRCPEVEGAPAFWPWLQILRQCIRLRGAAHVRDLIGPSAAEIAAALPELRAVLDGVATAPPIDDAHARFRLFDGVAQFLVGAAAERPLAVILDDLQRADQPSLRLLAFLAGQLRGAHILVVGTYRPSLDCDAPWPQLLRELAGSDGTSCITLSGMQPDETAEYVELAAGRKPPESVVEDVQSLTAGNPLFLRQLVHGWLASGNHCDFEWFGRSGQGQNLREAVARWLSRLSAASRGLLRIASVIGRDFSVATLARSAELPITAVLESLSEAAGAGVIRPVGDVVGRYRYVHALLRDALYDQLSSAERARLHGRVGEAIETQHAQPTATEIAELAHHFVQAAPREGNRRALLYARRAAELALGSFAYEQAAAHLDQALQVLELGTPEPEERLELLLLKGEALASAEQIAAARAALDQAVAMASSSDNRDALARAALAMSKPLEPSRVDLEYVRLLEKVLGLLPECDGRRPVLTALLARALLYSGDHPRRTAIAADAVRSAHQLSDPRARAETLRYCLQALSEPEHHADRIALTDELTELARRTDDHPLLLHATFARLQAQLELGELANVDVTISTMKLLATQTRQPYFRWIAAVVSAMRAITAGDLAAGEELVRQARALGVRFHEPTAHCIYCVQMNGIWRLQGQIEKARELVRHISACYPAVAAWRAVLSYLEAQLGQGALAHEELRRLIDTNLRSVRRDPFVMSTLAPLADLTALVGDAGCAEVVYDALLPYARYHGVVWAGAYTHGPMERHLGALATKMKRFDVAEAHLKRAIELTERMPSPPYVCLARQAYALMLLKRGGDADRELARLELDAALALSRTHGIVGLTTQSLAIAERYGLELGERGCDEAAAPGSSAAPRRTAQPESIATPRSRSQ